MIRTTMLAMVIGAVLLGSAEAKTPGPICKEECGPRIEQDCGSLRGKARRRCRRGLMRACKQTTPELACALDAGSGVGGGSGRGSGGAGGSGSHNGGSQNEAVQAITALLGNKLVTLGSSEFFSSGSITRTQKIRLCSSGSVLLVETTITSTTGLGDIDNTFDDTKTFDGTWRVRFVAGAPVLELDLGEAEPRQLAITQDDQGRLFLDGTRADIEDATECGGTPGQPGGTTGTPDVVQQVTEALGGHALIVTETNVGFGTRTTVIVLCTSSRYVKDVTVSAVPGQLQESIGAWQVQLDGSQPVLVLTDDRTGGVTRFTIGTDAQQNVLLNGLAATEGDASAVPGICAQI
jgi:hypothetical protein